MKIGLIDVDGHNFPSLPLMKLSAWHKKQGDSVGWYDPLTAWKNPKDRVYMSKVFTFTPDYQHPVNAAEVIKGGTGYFYPDGGAALPDEVREQIQETAKKIYRVLGCRGLARIDLFLREDGSIVLNEVNTMPGFTSYSRYPRMMTATGFTLSEILDRLIGLSLRR